MGPNCELLYLLPIIGMAKTPKRTEIWSRLYKSLMHGWKELIEVAALGRRFPSTMPYNDLALNEKKIKYYRLQWGPHIKALSGRLNSAPYAVKQIRQLTDFFHSRMSYGFLLWGRAADRAIRAIYNLPRRESLKELCKTINVLTVPSQFIYKNIISDRHNFNTRAKNKLAIPQFRLIKVQKSFMGFCVKCYNKLPTTILNLNEKKFKSCIKRELFNRHIINCQIILNIKMHGNMYCRYIVPTCIYNRVTMEFLTRSSPFEATLWNKRLASLTDRLTNNSI
uniref:SFRICE_031986 n=1 Tax=Spodoptera frugiperda TaxID=7108 RepID=A0A2H1W245_SPOFR